MKIDKTKDISSLLSFFDPIKFDHQVVSDVIFKVLNIITQKDLGNHKAGCAWVVMILYKNGKCSTIQIEDLIDKFIEYNKGYNEYFNSIVIGDKYELPITYYNGFVHKIIKGA